MPPYSTLCYRILLCPPGSGHGHTPPTVAHGGWAPPFDVLQPRTPATRRVASASWSPPHSPFPSSSCCLPSSHVLSGSGGGTGRLAGSLKAVPGTVWVPRQHALGAAPVQAAVGQWDLENTAGVTHIEDALGRERCRAEPPPLPSPCWAWGGLLGHPHCLPSPGPAVGSSLVLVSRRAGCSPRCEDPRAAPLLCAGNPPLQGNRGHHWCFGGPREG